VVDVIGLYGVITGGTQDALTMFDVPQDGFIIGVDWDMSLNLDADNEDGAAELSFIATNQLTASDVRGRISSISSRLYVGDATGAQAVSVQKWLSGFDISVSGGERMYVHAVSTAGVTGEVRCNVFLDQPGTARRSARRR